MDDGSLGGKRAACPLCGNSRFRLRYPANDDGKKRLAVERFRCTAAALSQHGDIVQCDRCGLLFADPQPSSAALLGVYRAVEDPLYLQETTARERTFDRSLRQLHRLVKPPGSLLDVGCYTGVFMRQAAKAGWRVTGVELSEWAVRIARQERVGPVISQPLEEAGLGDESFDVVTLWDVIEHLDRPVAMLEIVWRLLKPGGIVALSTHRMDSLAARLLGRRYPFFMDMHLVHFSKPTLRRLLTTSGFEPLAWRRHQRVLRLGYFLDRLQGQAHLGPWRSAVDWMARWSSSRELFVVVGFLGLVNVFARKS